MGILPIKKLKTQSALNNFSQFSMLNAGAISPYVGFTQDEVKKLCEKYNQDFGKAKIWYDGYQLAGYHLYNPNSISRYTGKILLVGINYDKKTKKHQCIIEKIQKADI